MQNGLPEGPNAYIHSRYTAIILTMGSMYMLMYKESSTKKQYFRIYDN